MNSSVTAPRTITFVGGGNMASALIGGLRRQGMAGEQITVVEPLAEQRQRLREQWGVQVLDKPGAELVGSELVVWAVKPQIFAQAAQQAGPHTLAALHLSVAAGIGTDTLARWLSSERIVRAMPNTPALIGRGITGLYARPAVSETERESIAAVIAPTGAWLWLEREDLLDAVTALSGSGPAYVFYFLEAMIEAGTRMGLTAEQSRQLALATFGGASALAAESQEPPAVLRERVTSKGGTTYAALSAMQAADMKAQFMAAIRAAQTRAQELGQEFGRG
ncbi:MAG: pyrroline-5-carboxylate reductase [Betaproteobacteria bacterium]